MATSDDWEARCDVLRADGNLQEDGQLRQRRGCGSHLRLGRTPQRLTEQCARAAAPWSVDLQRRLLLRFISDSLQVCAQLRRSCRRRPAKYPRHTHKGMHRPTSGGPRRLLRCGGAEPSWSRAVLVPSRAAPLPQRAAAPCWCRAGPVPDPLLCGGDDEERRILSAKAAAA